jgi:antirestriction protein ArdC
MAKQTQTEIREEITAKIMASLEKGDQIWRKPWTLDPNCGLPQNLASKRRYRGINTLLLELSALENRWRSQWWGTFKQFKEFGASVRKGEKGTGIVFYRKIEVDDDKSKTGKKEIFLMRFYTVFNLEQVNDKEGKLKKYMPLPAEELAEIEKHPDYAESDRIVAATGADIRYGGNKAVYYGPTGAEFPKHTGGDFIQMPSSRQFPDQKEFHEVRFHELVHWSEIRRQWKGSYAMGEIVAEMACCYLSRAAHIPMSDDVSNHAKYVKSWLKKMKDDPKWIFRAANEASKATDYILHFSQDVPGYKPGDEISTGSDDPDVEED